MAVVSGGMAAGFEVMTSPSTVVSALLPAATSDELMAWLKAFDKPPRRTFVTHGEPAVADALRLRIKDELGWEAHVPEHLETVELEH